MWKHFKNLKTINQCPSLRGSSSYLWGIGNEKEDGRGKEQREVELKGEGAKRSRIKVGVGKEK